MKVFEITALGKPKDRRFKEYSFLGSSDEVWRFIAPDGEGLNGVPFGRKWILRRLLADETATVEKMSPRYFSCLRQYLFAVSTWLAE